MLPSRTTDADRTSNQSGRRRFLGSLGLGATALMVLPKLVHAEPKPNLRTMNLEAQTVEQVNGKFVLPDLPFASRRWSRGSTRKPTICTTTFITNPLLRT